MASDGKGEGNVKKNRSVLDDVPVQDKAFPLRGKRDPGAVAEEREPLEIVSACPRCGCPIYGKKRITADEPLIVHLSCDCAQAQQRSPTIQEAMQTK